MHDDFGQLLATMKLDLAMLEHETVEGCAARSHVRHLHLLVDAMMSSVRRIISEQPPKILEEEGLASAIELLVDGFRTRHPIAFFLELALPSAIIAMQIQQAVYRVLQETLNNAVRHAKAAIIRIRINCSDAQIYLHIADDGRGAVAAEFDKPESVGLVWMRDRVVSLGGSMQITSTAGTGTSIDIRLPYAVHRAA